MPDHLRSVAPSVRPTSPRPYGERPPAREVRPEDDAQVKLAICILIIAAVLYVVSIAT